MSLLRIGIHTSIASSLEKSALIAAELGANTFQNFFRQPAHVASVHAAPR